MKNPNRFVALIMTTTLIFILVTSFTITKLSPPRTYPQVYKTEATVLKIRSVPGEPELVEVILDKDFQIFMERKDAWDINQNDVFVVYTDIKNKIKGINIEQHPKNQ